MCLSSVRKKPVYDGQNNPERRTQDSEQEDDSYQALDQSKRLTWESQPLQK
jgi:hypothetical protein